MTPFISRTAGPLRGKIAVPGDKSISHRALIFGALAVGRTRITGLLEGDDVLRTARAMRSLGATVERQSDGVWTVDGVGVGGLAEPEDVIDFGNSGTGARLVLGALATSPLTATLTGDASLRKRPMRRVTLPLEQMGARILARSGERLPLTIVGTGNPVPISYKMPVPSAQVKSAILLAALNTPGDTMILETLPTRDHTERMLRHFGASITRRQNADGTLEITIRGETELRPAELDVPGDPSSAAFPMVAALIVPGSDIFIEGVGFNPLRAGLITTLKEMGASIELSQERLAGGEPVVDLAVRASPLRGVSVPAERAPSMIDEYPILAIAAAFAQGRTIMQGLGELRVKESDRLGAIVRGLISCGATALQEGDTLIIDGTGRPPLGGARIAAQLDHRIAMSFLSLGLAAEQPVEIDDGETIGTSFPGFADLMNGIGAAIKPLSPVPETP